MSRKCFTNGVDNYLFLLSCFCKEFSVCFRELIVTADDKGQRFQYNAKLFARTPTRTQFGRIVEYAEDDFLARSINFA